MSLPRCWFVTLVVVLVLVDDEGEALAVLKIIAAAAATAHNEVNTKCTCSILCHMHGCDSDLILVCRRIWRQ